MQKFVILLFFFFNLIGCTGNKSDESIMVDQTPGDTTQESFFPVTDFIKGQIADIKTSGVNPLKYITQSGKTDSVWLKVEDLEKELNPFLEIPIDSSNMSSYFKETKFLDQTINAYTFSYEPTALLPDTFPLRRWDVYVDPVAERVKRVYILKTSGNTTTQLTWLSETSGRIVTLKTDENGKSSLEKEVLINWDF